MSAPSTDLSEWQPVTEPTPLSSDSVHVWRASLDRSDTAIECLLRTLTEDEQRRAQRFHFEEDRRHYIAARGILRALLGRYVGADPAELRFSYNSYGKPSLNGEPCLRFNLSHSGGLGLYALALEREVGVDVERVRPEFTGQAIAERFFSPNEIAILCGLPAELRIDAFFNCWTRKEAYIKARGKGLAIPLDQFDVSLAPHEPAAVLADRETPAETGRWAMWRLNPGVGFAGAAAAEGNGGGLICRDWPEDLGI